MITDPIRRTSGRWRPRPLIAQERAAAASFSSTGPARWWSVARDLGHPDADDVHAKVLTLASPRSRHAVVGFTRLLTGAGGVARLHVGCAMWTHKAWLGRFVPQSLPAGERLRAYAGWCNAVEGNTTFYATPARNTVATWARQTGPDFRMVVKLPKVVTHERRFAGVESEMRAFLDAIEPLGERAVLWTQLPASFGPADVDALGRFLRRLPADRGRAVEVRHPGFFTDARSTASLEQTLTDAATEWVPFDTTAFFRAQPASEAEREAWARKPRLPRRTRALTDRPIVRYLGRDSVAETVQGWEPWAEVAAGWLRDGRSPTVFVHTPDNTVAPALARRFHDDVRALVPDLDALPEPAPVEPATLF